jgi:hypothetical protein
VYGSALARFVHRLPAPVAGFIRRKLGTRLGCLYSSTTPQAALGVWVELVGTNTTPPAPSMLMDETGTLAGNMGKDSNGRIYLSGPAKPVVPIFFPLVPRRSRTLECCFFDSPTVVGFSFFEHKDSYQEIGRVRFPNPVFDNSRGWKPEPLPTSHQSGELEVRLEEFTTGKPAAGTRLDDFLGYHRAPGTSLADLRPAGKGREAWTGFSYSLASPAGADAIWALHCADLSDPGGNHLRRYWYKRDDWPYQILEGTLWPAEAAWRLKLEFKRKSGFTAAELITFTNVPLLYGSILRTNLVNGVPLVLMGYIPVRSPFTPAFQIASPSLEGTALDFVQLVTDQGESPAMKETQEPDLASFRPLTPAPRVIRFANGPPTNAQTVNLTWVLQKTRSVEFFVQPPHQEGRVR